MPKNGRKSRRREYIYEKGKNTIQYVIDGVLLIVCIMLTLVFEYQRNRSRDLEYVGRYIDELSTTIAIHVEDVFLDKLAFIDSAAYLYGRVCKAEDYELLAMRLFITIMKSVV